MSSLTHEFHRKGIQTLLKTIKEDFWSDVKEDDEKEIFYKYAHLAKKFIIFQVISTFLSAQLWVVKPFVEMYILAPEDSAKPVDRTFPFKNFAPFNIVINTTGQFKLLQGLEVAYSAFGSNWFEASQRIKSSILIVIIRAQRPMYLTAIKFAPISCSSFETSLMYLLITPITPLPSTLAYQAGLRS
ncbi:hypothetical protein CBL_20320 [Carabus blaptoides fortunei]